MVTPLFGNSRQNRKWLYRPALAEPKRRPHWRIDPATADHEAASRIINDDVLRHRLHRRVHTVIESGAVPAMLRWPGGAPIHSIGAGSVLNPPLCSSHAV